MTIKSAGKISLALAAACISGIPGLQAQDKKPVTTKSAVAAAKTVKVEKASTMKTLSEEGIKLDKQTKPIKPKTLKIVDFGKGFAMFHKLGVPDVSNCEYIKIPQGTHYDYRRNLSGNAWLVKDNKEEGFVAWVNNCKVSYLCMEEVLKKQQKEIATVSKKYSGNNRKLNQALTRTYRKYGRIRSGNFKKADLKKDIKTVAKMMKKLEKDSWELENNAGKLLLFAVYCYDKGFKAEANKLASQLFANMPKKQVILAAINELGDNLYAGIFEDFSRNSDWKKYEAALAGLIRKMPSAWKQKAVMKLLLKRIKERIAGKVPVLADPKLSDEDKKLAVAMIKIKEIPYQLDFWLLPDPDQQENDKKTKKAEIVKKTKVEAEAEKTVDEDLGEKVLKQIFDRKVEAIPFLLTVLNDHYLTDLTQASYYQPSFSGFGNDDNRESLEKRYSKMRSRPFSRGEIAKTLLSSIVIEFNRYNENAEDALPDKAREIYQQLKGKNTEEIALFYLENGSNTQKYYATKNLAASKNPQTLAKLEKYFLNNAGFEIEGQVDAYLTKRGSKAKDFVEKFIVVLSKGKNVEMKKMLKHAANNPKQVERMKKDFNDRYKRFEKKLRMYLSTETLEQYLMKQAAKKKLDDNLKRVIGLKIRMSKLEGDKILSPIIRAAAVAVEPQVKISFLDLIEEFNRHSLEKPDAGDKKFSDYKGTKAAWMKLFNDNRIYEKVEISDKALKCFAGFLDPGLKQYLKLKLDNLPKPNRVKLFRTRAMAKLENKTIPAYPDASKVSDAQYDKTALALLNTPDDKLAAAVARLSDSMLLKIYSKLKKSPKLNAKLLVLANQINKVNIAIKDKKLLEKLSGLKGKINQDKVRSIFEFMKNTMVPNKQLSCMVSCDGINGVEISFTEKNLYMKKTNPDSRFLLAGGLLLAGKSADCTWRTAENKKAEPVKKAATDKLENEQIQDKENIALITEAETELMEELKEELSSYEKDFWEAIDGLNKRSNAMDSGKIYFDQQMR